MPASFQSVTGSMPPSDTPNSSPSFSGALFPVELNSRGGAGSASPEPFGHTRQERKVVRLSYVISLASFRLKDTETLHSCQECTILPWTMTTLYTT
jgi:hypothetical protein